MLSLSVPAILSVPDAGHVSLLDDIETDINTSRPLRSLVAHWVAIPFLAVW